MSRTLGAAGHGRIPRLVVAGASSGVGKTTVAIGLMAALRRRGLAIQPFKVGPDYIDPTYHLAATGVPSRNLDGWMLPEAALLELFARACHQADVALIEGVMGVFDGTSGQDETASTAQLSKRLKAPVVLVLDASGAARSLGAMALGFARFDPALRVEGFLLNRVRSESHYRAARDAIESSGAGQVLGYLPADPELNLPERHLGLVPTDERPLPEGFLERLVDLLEGHVNLQCIQEIASSAPSITASEGRAGRDAGPYVASATHSSLFPPEPVPPKATIAVAQDEAFSFYYQDNLDLLQAHGARLLPFSPLRDPEVPAEADALYLGGGFPEVHAAQLAGNRSMRDSVQQMLEKGMPVYGECGGLMFLTQGIVGSDGTRYPMVGGLPGSCSMKEKRLKLGYLQVRSLRDTPLGPQGFEARGHEFHWSLWNGLDPSAGAYELLNRSGQVEGYARDNLLASFVHLHFGANPRLAPAFVQSAHQWYQKKR